MRQIVSIYARRYFEWEHNADVSHGLLNFSFVLCIPPSQQSPITGPPPPPTHPPQTPLHISKTINLSSLAAFLLLSEFSPNPLSGNNILYKYKVEGA